MNSGEEIEAGSEWHLFMHELSQEALRVTAEMNNAYRTPEELVELMRKLTGQSDFPVFGMSKSEHKRISLYSIGQVYYDLSRAFEIALP